MSGPAAGIRKMTAINKTISQSPGRRAKRIMAAISDRRSVRIAPRDNVVQVDFAEPLPARVLDAKKRTAAGQHQVQSIFETGSSGNRFGSLRLAGLHKLLDRHEVEKPELQGFTP